MGWVFCNKAQLEIIVFLGFKVDIKQDSLLATVTGGAYFDRMLAAFDVFPEVGKQA